MVTNEEMREHMADGWTDGRTRSRGRKDGELAEGREGKMIGLAMLTAARAGRKKVKLPQ